MYVQKTKNKTKATKMNCQGHNQNIEEGCTVQQWAQAVDQYSAAERSETESEAAAVAGREYLCDREYAAVAQKACEHHQLTAAKCLKLVAVRELEAAQEWKTTQEQKVGRERREDQYPSHAPQYRNQLEAGGQIVYE